MNEEVPPSMTVRAEDLHDLGKKSSTFIGPIAQIRAELEAATPGPWELFKDGGHYVTIRPGLPPHNAFSYSAREADATLIANAPTYLAALLDVAEAAQAFRGGPGVEFAGVLGKLNEAFDRLDACANPQCCAEDEL